MYPSATGCSTAVRSPAKSPIAAPPASPHKIRRESDGLLVPMVKPSILSAIAGNGRYVI
jgi:hypothetical protein